MEKKRRCYPLTILDIFSIVAMTFLTWIFVRTVATAGINWSFINVLKFILYILLFYAYPVLLIVVNHSPMREKKLLINGLTLLDLTIVVIRSIYIALDKPADDFEVCMFLIIFAILPILVLIFNNRTVITDD